MNVLDDPGVGAPVPTLEEWLRYVRTRVDETLAQAIQPPDDALRALPWTQALDQTRQYAGRPGKRLRPALLAAGYGLGGGAADMPPALWTFGTAVELLHTFMLIHDDIADGAAMRRGGPALHRVFGGGKNSEDLAVVMGDYLFARAIEIMLDSGLPRAHLALRHYLAACRNAASGQYLDCSLERVRLSEVSLFLVLHVAKLKTALPSFAAPLAAGALLAGAPRPVIDTVTRVGLYLGVAFQLRDDLLGLFGDSRTMGKPCDCDLIRGKCTFPVLAAYLRAPEDVRGEMDELWSVRGAHAGALPRARQIVRDHGGLAATERAVAHASRIARAALRGFPEEDHFRRLLEELTDSLILRNS